MSEKKAAPVIPDAMAKAVKDKIKDQEEKRLKAFEGVPYADVLQPEVSKWRTVTYEARTHPDEPPEKVSLRLHGNRAQVYQAALEHLQKVTWNEEGPTDEFVTQANQGSTHYLECVSDSIDSIRIADNCPCCHR